MSFFSWFRSRPDVQEQEFNTGLSLIEGAQRTNNIYTRIDLIDGFLQLAGKSPYKEMYNVTGVKDLVLESVNQFLISGGNLDRRQLGITYACGSSLGEELEKRLGITRKHIGDYAIMKKQEECRSLYDKIGESLLKHGWFSPLYDIKLFRRYSDVKRSLNEEVADKNIAFFALNILEKMFFPEKFKARDILMAGSDQTLHAYDDLQRVVAACSCEIIQSKKTCLYENIDKKIELVEKQVEKAQNCIYFACEELAQAGAKDYFVKRDLFIKISTTYSRVLDEDTKSIMAQVTQLDEIFRNSVAASSKV
ncbi:MAG: hypothetical protein HY363_05980 [Candidatus Aenigmarchaeota archaeon]|nr:hypothetical protein [Candidatus Aenigmarchaeota archaeon]